MTSQKKTWEEQFDEQWDNLWIFDGTNKSYTSCEQEVKNFISQALAEATKAEREKVCKEIEKTEIGKAHTYSSENADVYRAFDNGQEHFKNFIINKLK